MDSTKKTNKKISAEQQLVLQNSSFHNILKNKTNLTAILNSEKPHELACALLILEENKLLTDGNLEIFHSSDLEKPIEKARALVKLHQQQLLSDVYRQNISSHPYPENYADYIINTKLYQSRGLRAIFGETLMVGGILTASYFKAAPSFSAAISFLGLASAHPALAIGILTAVSAVIFSLITAVIYYVFTPNEKDLTAAPNQKLK